MKKLIFEEHIKRNKAAFIAKVKEVSNQLGIDPNWLMAIMYLESRFNEKAVNPYSGATGLIQFMDATAKGLGTSLAALKGMSNVQQLDYVYKHFYPYRKKINGFQDLYLATFFPVAMGKVGSYVLKTSRIAAGTIARQNPAYDLNKDGEVTVDEIKKAIISKIPKEFQRALRKKP